MPTSRRTILRPGLLVVTRRDPDEGGWRVDIVRNGRTYDAESYFTDDAADARAEHDALSRDARLRGVVSNPRHIPRSTMAARRSKVRENPPRRVGRALYRFDNGKEYKIPAGVSQRAAAAYLAVVDELEAQGLPIPAGPRGISPTQASLITRWGARRGKKRKHCACAPVRRRRPSKPRAPSSRASVVVERVPGRAGPVDYPSWLASTFVPGGRQLPAGPSARALPAGPARRQLSSGSSARQLPAPRQVVNIRVREEAPSDSLARIFVSGR